MNDSFDANSQDIRALNAEMTQLRESTRSLRDSVRPLNTEVQEFRMGGLDPLLRNLEQVTLGSKKASTALADLGLSIAENIARGIGAEAARRKKEELGATVADVIGASLVGFRAAGGPVGEGNPFIVGEKGPELFVPDSPGHVVPGDRFTGLRPGPVNITITNSSGHEVQAKGSRNAQGGVDVEVMIDSYMARALTRPGSRTNAALNAVFGLSPGLSRR